MASTQTLTELPNIQYTGMDYDTVMGEIYNIINDNPNWKENWSDFYSSDSGTMFIQLMAWIADNLSLKNDLMLNELFLSTANKDENKIKLLNTINYMPKKATASTVYIAVEALSSYSGDIILVPGKASNEPLGSRVSKILKITGQDSTGASATYEILRTDKNGKPDYLNSVILKNDPDNIYTSDSAGYKLTALEGETKSTSFSSNTSDGPYFDLTVSNLADNSIRIYDSNGREHIQVNNFLQDEARNEDYGPSFVLEFVNMNTIRIRYPSKNTISSQNKRFKAGGTITVFYRTCNGTKGNIPVNFINTTQYLTTTTNATVNVNIYNNLIGVGGSNAETLDEAVKNGPLSIRTMDRAVTPSDYDIILKKYSDMFKCKTYSATNNPKNFKNYYGRHINPQEAFSFVLLNKDYEKVPPSEYNNFPWVDLKEVPVLNEEYIFDDGRYNYVCTGTELINNLKINKNGTQYENYSNASIIDVGVEFNRNVNYSGVLNDKLKLKIDYKRSDNSYFGNFENGLLYDIPFLEKVYGTENVLQFKNLAKNNYLKSEYTEDENGNILSDRRKITFDTNARFISSVGVSKININGESCAVVDCSILNKIKFCLDGKQTITVDLLKDMPEGQNANGKRYFLTLGLNSYDLATPKEQAEISSRELTWDEYDAVKRSSIVSLINKQLIELKTTQDTDSQFDLYDEDTAVQFFGGAFESKDVQLVKVYNQTQIYFEINGIKFVVNNPANASTCTLENFVASLNNDIHNNQGNVFMYDGLNTSALSNEAKDILNSVFFGYTSLFNHDNLNAGNLNNISYDIFIASKTKNILTNGRFDFKDVPNRPSFKDIVENESFYPEMIVAADYANVASVLDYDGNQYLEIISPVTGKASSVFFERADYNSDFMEGVFNLKYPINDQYSYTAYGIKSLTLITNEVVSILDGNSNLTLLTNLKVGNVILENNSINLPPYFENFYASYKISESEAVLIGSQYDNFYFNGDSNDELMKPKIIGLLGQSVDSYYDNEELIFSEDPIKSDYIIKMTKDKVDVNSIHAIETDVDGIPMNFVNVKTNQITSSLSSGAYLAFKIDNNTFVVTDEELSKANTSTGLYNLLINTIFEKNDNSAYEEMVDNRYSIVTKSNTLRNQLIFSNLTKNSEYGRVSFVKNYEGKEQEQSAVNELYLKLLGTNKTNPDLYDIYPKEVMSELASDNIKYLNQEEYYYVPTGTQDLNFYYRTLDNDGNSVCADYYITSYEASDKYHKKYYTYFISKTENSNFQDTPFYLHIVNNRKYEVDNDGLPVVLEEDVLQNYIKKYKIAGMDITFLKPYFKTFDIQADIIYDRNFSLQQIQSSVKEKMNQEFNLGKADIAKSVYRSKIYKILNSIDGIQSVNLNYFGPNYDTLEQLEDPNVYTADFYEIIILHEDVAGKRGLVLNFSEDDNE